MRCGYKCEGKKGKKKWKRRRENIIYAKKPELVIQVGSCWTRFKNLNLHSTRDIYLLDFFDLPSSIICILFNFNRVD